MRRAIRSTLLLVVCLLFLPPAARSQDPPLPTDDGAALQFADDAALQSWLDENGAVVPFVDYPQPPAGAAPRYGLTSADGRFVVAEWFTRKPVGEPGPEAFVLDQFKTLVSADSRVTIAMSDDVGEDADGRYWVQMLFARVEPSTVPGPAPTVRWYTHKEYAPLSPIRSLSHDGRVLIRDSGDGIELQRFNDDFSSTRIGDQVDDATALFDPSGNWLIRVANSQAKTGPWRAARYLGPGEDGTPQFGPELEFPCARKNVLAASPDGDLLVTHDSIGHVQLWHAGRDHTLRMGATIAADYGFNPNAATNGRVLAISNLDGVADVYRLNDDGGVLAVLHLPTGGVAGRVAMPVPGRDAVIAQFGYGDDPDRVMLRPAGCAAHRVTVAGCDIELGWPTAPAAPGVWPDLVASLQHRLEADGRLILDATVRNAGDATAWQVVGRFECTPEPEWMQRGPIHFGTLAPGASVTRRLVVEKTPLQTTAMSIRFHAQSSAARFKAQPAEWFHIPLEFADPAAYHARAREVFDAAVELMRELTGDAIPHPRLSELPANDFGFKHRGLGGDDYTSTVYYQCPFGMGPNAMRVNRDVMQVPTHDDFMRHAGMMLYWYIPHEVIHAFDYNPGWPGWRTEYTANVVQPYLTALLLKKLETPYTPEFFRLVYERYVRMLQPHCSVEDVQSVDRFILGEGGLMFQPEGLAGWVMMKKTDFYVYFGARINQMSWVRESSMADLMKRVNKWPEPEKSSEPEKRDSDR